MRKFNVIVNGAAYSVEIEEIGAASAPAAQATPAPIAPVAATPASAPAPKPVAPVKKTAAPAGGTKVDCPMPGTVVGIKVTDGQTVKKGQTLLVLEAMKMENEISSPADGVVTVVCSKGDSLSTGDLIAIIA
ncbi:MAG: biotin/lipoyl-binding protein [Clostridiales bacterium]|jgi:glutaconyl-CoA decarboxylase|nr:biotin/lipoyl-binding protein [Clostridiales bacterium]